MLIVDTTRRMRRPHVSDSSPTRQVPPETLWLLTAFYAFVQDLSQGAKQRPNAAPTAGIYATIVTGPTI